MTLEQALHIRRYPAHMLSSANVVSAMLVLADEVERLRANALWLKDVADKRGEECDARLNKRPGANRA